MKRGSPADARLVALHEISAVMDDHQALGDESFSGRLDARDTAFARRLSYGVVRWYNALDWLSRRLLDKPLKSRDADVHRLILLGIYQLWQEDTSSHAAVHATAECARKLGKDWAVGLVNAVLRRFQREKDSLLGALEDVEEQYAHPRWLLKQMKQDWPQQWRDIAEANNRQPPLWVRCNGLRSSVDEVLLKLRAEDFEASRHPWARQALNISPPAPVERLPGFNEGHFSVQDAVAQLAAQLLDVQPGQRVLDACAAPGGKTCHLLESYPEAEVLAIDLHESRLTMVQQNLDRLGLKAELQAADACRPDDWWDGRAFDRILLDAPCTATGVIRRHPEIKWLRDPDQVAEAVALQHSMLRNLWPLLQAGGIFVYATCSVLKQENSHQINSFLESHPEAMCLGPDFPGADDSEPGCQFLPGQEDMDGFYYAVLHKSA